MSYKIAVASSDGTQIDETFGSAKVFIIFEVTGEEYRIAEQRIFRSEETSDVPETCSPVGGCGSSNGCGSGGGCGGNSHGTAKVEMIADCRCVVCKKIGFHIQKQLERKAISAFDVSCSVEEAIEKITAYYRRADGRKAIRG